MKSYISLYLLKNPILVYVSLDISVLLSPSLQFNKFLFSVYFDDPRIMNREPARVFDLSLHHYFPRTKRTGTAIHTLTGRLL